MFTNQGLTSQCLMTRVCAATNQEMIDFVWSDKISSDLLVLEVQQLAAINVEYVM